ncbi:MAG: TraR/DksA C4-type zinc finger protein [Deltaproteobacteria bacterium]|nr:TraR/DksA C4-type zinc finger protein [Deltaproteobacteria bacterium]
MSAQLDIERLRADLHKLRDALLAEGDLPIEPATDKTDDDEAPLAEMNQVIASKRNAERAATLKRIAAALTRLENDPDDFGNCVECGDPIGKRLLALPYVDLCLQCQEEQDGSPKAGRRRHLMDFR